MLQLGQKELQRASMATIKMIKATGYGAMNKLASLPFIMGLDQIKFQILLSILKLQRLEDREKIVLFESDQADSLDHSRKSTGM